MSFNGQMILPALRNLRDFEALLKSPYKHIVLLDIHIGNLHDIVQEVKQHRKNILVHVDLIQGLKGDEYGADYLCNQIRPHGLISTRANVIVKAKQKGLIAVQRLFLLDSHALNKSYVLLEKTKPDYIEVLPGIIPQMIEEVRAKVKQPVIAGGLIRTVDDVNHALQAGVEAVTTSNKKLWEYYAKQRIKIHKRT